jgi:hypothetical protein
MTYSAYGLSPLWPVFAGFATAIGAAPGNFGARSFPET